jgi:hypothetical protein
VKEKIFNNLETLFSTGKKNKLAAMAPSAAFASLVSQNANASWLTEEELAKAVALVKAVLTLPPSEFPLTPSNAKLQRRSEKLLNKIKRRVSEGE